MLTAKRAYKAPRIGEGKLGVTTDRLVVNVFNADAALNVACGRGLFAEEGIDVELLVTPNSTDQMRGLGKGSWPIVSTAFDNVLG